jgi:hypothetical protein
MGGGDKVSDGWLAENVMKNPEENSPASAPLSEGGLDILERVEDYNFPGGWESPATAGTRARECCQWLEEGRILYFERMPFLLFKEDKEFLLAQHQSGSRLHKNISYRPSQDVLRGSAASPRQREHLHEVMRRYSTEVARFLGQLLTPYAQEWALDYASFRPQEEQGRDLPLHKRNDLLHFDSFPTRPMNGHRILRCFTNINPSAPRVWNTTEGFSILAQRYAAEAGLAAFAAKGSPRAHPLLRSLKQALGFKAADPSAYDRFMLRFHDYLKEKSDFQQNCPKTRLEFQPGWTWICYTDAVPHAVLSGRYALEQTFIIPLPAMVAPENAPVRVLERLAGMPLTRGG